MSETNPSDVVIHYGVKGMKWGVRRDQRTLDRLAGRRTGSTRREQNEINRRAGMRSARRTLSDGDLEGAIKRLQAEKKLKELIDSDIDPGRVAMQQILKRLGQAGLATLGVAATGTLMWTIRGLITKEWDLNAKGSSNNLASLIKPKK